MTAAGCSRRPPTAGPLPEPTAPTSSCADFCEALVALRHCGNGSSGDGVPGSQYVTPRIYSVVGCKVCVGRGSVKCSESRSAARSATADADARRVNPMSWVRRPFDPGAPGLRTGRSPQSKAAMRGRQGWAGRFRICLRPPFDTLPPPPLLRQPASPEATQVERLRRAPADKSPRWTGTFRRPLPRGLLRPVLNRQAWDMAKVTNVAGYKRIVQLNGSGGDDQVKVAGLFASLFTFGLQRTEGFHNRA